MTHQVPTLTTDEELKAATAQQLVIEIDRLSAMIAKCFAALAEVSPKPMLVDGEKEFGDSSMTSYEDGVACEKAAEVSRRILRASKRNDLGGCPLCRG
jgi:hypothetical protein